MPVALIFIGVILIVAAVRGTQDQLFTLLKSDLTGDQNFFYWVLAFIFVIAIGYDKTLRPVSNAFLGLLIIVLLLANKGFFPSLIEQVKEGTSGEPASSGGSTLGVKNKDIKTGVSIAKNVGKIASIFAV